MLVTLLGTGGPWPDPDRNGSAYLLQYNGKPYLIDCGGGVNRQLMKVQVPPSQLDNIFLTHLHIDHCFEYPSLVFGAYLTGKEGSYHLFGPEGTAHFASSIFQDTYDFAIPTIKKILGKDISIIMKEVTGGVVLEDNGLIVEAISVNHRINALAYKYSAQGKSVVFSGDTAPCENIVIIAQNADVLIIECSFPEAFGPNPVHCIPSQVGAIAQKAHVKKVVLTHLFPPCKGHEEEIIADVKKIFDGPVVVGQDLMTLPV